MLGAPCALERDVLCCGYHRDTGPPRRGSIAGPSDEGGYRPNSSGYLLALEGEERRAILGGCEVEGVLKRSANLVVARAVFSRVVSEDSNQDVVVCSGATERDSVRETKEESSSLSAPKRTWLDARTRR